MKRPKTRPVARETRGKTKYALYLGKHGHELWTMGRHGYFCGYVADPENLAYAIDVHEEELLYLLKEWA
jgi:hypothetical protein